MPRRRCEEILALDEAVSVWDEVLAREPHPELILHGEAIDRALATMGDFADLITAARRARI